MVRATLILVDRHLIRSNREQSAIHPVSPEQLGSVDMKPTTILLSFNSEDTLAATLSRARMVSDEIFVVDSFSQDKTTEIAKTYQAHIVQRRFETYGEQRNWAMDNLPITGKWQLHLDADEWLDDRLVSTINALTDEPEVNGYFVARYVRFLGRTLRHGGMNPTWHLRLFRTGIGRCEERKYDQHFLLTTGRAAQLRGTLIDDIRMPLAEWTARHNRWSDGEVSEIESRQIAGLVKPDLFGNPIQKKRFFRNVYGGLPILLRPFGLFIYRYFVRLGFLDGTEGFIFWVLQTFWFRFLIDAKLWEKKHVLSDLRNE